MRALPLLLLAVTACATSAPAQRPPKTPAVAQVAPRADTCPLALSGAQLEVKDLEQGVALEFTTYEDVSELRRRVRLLGDIQHAPAGRRYLEDVEGGARIVFPAEVKNQVVSVAQAMEGGACPITLPTKPDDRIVSR